MKREKTIVIVHENDGSTRRVELTGRFAECLRALARCGSRGITAADFAAGTRVSHYVFVLRKRFGFQISTTLEPNTGPLGGEHARYRLLDRVQVLGPGIPPGGLSARDFGQAA